MGIKAPLTLVAERHEQLELVAERCEQLLRAPPYRSRGVQGMFPQFTTISLMSPAV